MGTLALNMIVGPGESQELERALESIDAKNTFDEIVIVSTSNDDSVKKIAKKYTNKVLYHQWTSERYPYGNFADARNKALDATDSDWFMWLDADDVILERDAKALSQLREIIISGKCDNDFDCIFVPYCVAISESGVPLRIFPRDRIIKKSTGYRWRGACHEQILPADAKVPHLKIPMDNFKITHLANKPPFASAERNIRILEHEYNVTNGRDPHVKYYYAHDMLLLGGEKEIKALNLMDEILDDMSMHIDMIYSIAWVLAQYYAWGGQSHLPTIDMLRDNRACKKAEKYARIAKAANPAMAEPSILLGDICYKRGLTIEAEACYKRASGCKLGTGLLQNNLFYKGIPEYRLANLYFHNEMFEKALVLYRQSYDFNCFPDKCKKRHKEIVEKLLEVF